MRVDWGEIGATQGTITVPYWPNWAPDLSLDLSSSSYMSIRLANLLQYPAVPDSEMSCEVEQAGVEVGIRLMDDDPDPEEARTVVGPLPRQDTDWSLVPPSMVLSQCVGPQAMTTFRIPMSRFCEPGFNAASLQAVEFSFEDPGFEAQVFIDSIEFTSNEFDDPGNICPTGQFAWACEASNVLAATETYCTTEPLLGSCSSPQQTGVSLPSVSEGMFTYDGWVIHSPAGSIVDETDPTIEELEWLEARCVQACEMEWEHDPDVQANCSASGAFVMPYLVESPSLGAFTLTRPEHLDGSGPFTGQSLTCNLDDSCCLEFDEALCVAKPHRVTRAREPLHVGEEFVVDADWMVSVVNSTSGMVADSARLTGTVGYSFCTGGNSSAPCPFYVGSMELDANSDLDVGVECPGGTETITLENLHVSLVQPAFGIDEEGTADKAFVPGGLVFEGTFTVSGVSGMQSIRGGNEVDVFIEANTTGFSAPGVEIWGTAPCTGGGMGTVGGVFKLVLDVGGSTVESPPSVAITSPSTVSCSGTLALSATVTDPDSDVTTLRWYVDDVLMSSSTTSITMTQDHTLRAVARDARGAARTATHSVTCI